MRDAKGLIKVGETNNIIRQSSQTRSKTNGAKRKILSYSRQAAVTQPNVPPRNLIKGVRGSRQAWFQSI